MCVLEMNNASKAEGAKYTPLFNTPWNNFLKRSALALHACNANADLFKKLFHGVLKRGVYFAPSAFEALFISNTHTYDLLDKTIEAIDLSLEEIL